MDMRFFDDSPKVFTILPLRKIKDIDSNLVYMGICLETANFPNDITNDSRICDLFLSKGEAINVALKLIKSAFKS